MVVEEIKKKRLAFEPEMPRKRRQGTSTRLFWQDSMVQKHTVNREQLMDGRTNFAGTWTPQLLRTTLTLLLEMNERDTKND